MLSAIATEMIGICLLRLPGLVRLHPKPGSIGSTVIGGLIFGVGLALLGHCPGTVAGAAGQGSMDAMLGELAGMLLGTGVYAAIYDRLDRKTMHIGKFDEITLPELLNLRTWPVVIGVSAAIVVFLIIMENSGT